MKVLIVTNTRVENEAVRKIWNGILKNAKTIQTFPTCEGKIEDNVIIYVHLGGSVSAISHLLSMINPNMVLIAGEMIGRYDIVECGDIVIATEIFTVVNKLENWRITHAMKANSDTFKYTTDDSKNVEVHQGPVEFSLTTPEIRNQKDWHNIGEVSAKPDVIGIEIGNANIYELIQLYNNMTNSVINYLLIKGVSSNGTQLEGVNEQDLKRIAAERSAKWILQFCQEELTYF
uniref:Nucleoside phosphorylase domain-containing protein n=1 Tax=Pithovirus LCPAC406 TaxID=2506599 RepID=A0A481ZIM9_9VIRU|nr:MAG: hypothetical protein LCPAC406_03150 [Pithovirus LCPAC406]